MTAVDLATEADEGSADHDGGDSEVISAGKAGRRLRLGPILPARFRPVNAPTLWVEALMIAITYSVYSRIRLFATPHKDLAVQRGYSIMKLERELHINIELSVNHWADPVTPLIVSANYYYATLHFIMPIAVLIWVHRKFPDRYRAVRTVLFAVTALAMVAFFVYALCPPRFMPGTGFIDTFDTHNTWGTNSAGVGGLPSGATDLYAAMPSLHIGWSTWCAITIANLAKRRWVKALGIAYPFFTFFVIIATANHYVLDAVAALMFLAAAFLVQRLLHGRPVYRRSSAADDDPSPTALPHPRTVPTAEQSPSVQPSR